MANLLHILSLLRGEPISIAEVFALAKRHRYDGPLTFHFRGGDPQSFETGRPIQGPVLSDGPRKDLDNRPAARTHSSNSQ